MNSRIVGVPVRLLLINGMNVDVKDPGKFVALLLVVVVITVVDGGGESFLECPFEGFSARNTSEVFGAIRE